MPTHDYIIDNSTGSNVRQDINNALAAIVSNNSNSSSPSTTYAYQWWADTSNNVLKIRNSANNAWIELLQLDGTLTLEDGSASTPALAFRDDLDTGIFSSAANTFNVATEGVERLLISSSATVFNDSGANVDFRIEGDNQANLFFVDAGNDRIGIGTNSPSVTLDIESTSPVIRLTDSDASGTPECQISAGGGDLVLSADRDNEKASTLMQFQLDGSAAMTIDSVGRVGIGTTSPSSFNVYANTLVVATSTNTGLTLSGNDASTNFSGIQFSAGTTVRAYIDQQLNSTGRMQLMNMATGHMAFGTSNQVRMTISSTGAVGIGTTSPQEDLHISSASPFIRFTDTVDDSHYAHIGHTDGSIFIIDADPANAHAGSGIQLKVDNSTVMFLEDSGHVGIGLTNPASLLHVSSSTTSYFRFQDLATETIGLLIRKNITASAYTALDFRNGNGPSGTLTVSTGSVSLSNASDYRLKENETVISDGITKIKQLIPRRFNFKKDPTNTLDGFFAHEVSGVVKEAVIGEKDATIDEDGNGYQQLDATKLIPILTAGLKEAISKIETLETKVAALEAA